MNLNIAYNKSTKEFVGYSNPKNGKATTVIAFSIDDLEKKFQKEVDKLKK